MEKLQIEKSYFVSVVILMKIRQIIKGVVSGQVTIVLFAAAIVIAVLVAVNTESISNTSEDIQAIEEAQPVMAPKTVDVILQRVYLDGEVSEETVQETIWSMEDFWAFYEGWDLVDQNEEKIYFKQEVNDISPLLKINGYFGISDEGYLNIYEGKPDHENIIQSFFQINTNKLKSHQHSRLKEGIPVISRENFEELLQTFEKYAVQEM